MFYENSRNLVPSLATQNIVQIVARMLTDAMNDNGCFLLFTNKTLNGQQFTNDGEVKATNNTWLKISKYEASTMQADTETVFRILRLLRLFLTSCMCFNY